MKLERDNKEVIKRTFDKVIEKYADEFEFVITHSRFIFTFRDKPMYDDEGMEIAAYARRVPNRERDLYDVDFEICVHEPIWDQLTDKGKERLIFHELLHCRVAEEVDEETEEPTGEPSYDNDGRINIYIEPHDLIIKTFRREIEVFGLNNKNDIDTAKFLAVNYKKYLENKKQK